MKTNVKINITQGTITEFIARNTKLNLKELIEKAIINYAHENYDKHLFTDLKLSEPKENIPGYVMLTFDYSDKETIEFLEKLPDIIRPKVCRNIFEVYIGSEHMALLATNGCYMPERTECDNAILNLGQIIDYVTANSSYDTTVGRLMLGCNQHKKTKRFVCNLFAKLKESGICICNPDGVVYTEEAFLSGEVMKESKIRMVTFDKIQKKYHSSEDKNITDSEECL